MLLPSRDLILSKLEEFKLSDLAAHLYDCSFGLLAAPPATKKLIMAGFNGSMADAVHTNAGAVHAGFADPTFSNLAELTRRSMAFFEQMTVPLCEPELIIAYSNSLRAPSAGKILWDSFGEGGSLEHVDTSAYYATYGFIALVAGRRVPVVGIRHLSRFDFGHKGALVRKAWGDQQSKVLAQRRVESQLNNIMGDPSDETLKNHSRLLAALWLDTNVFFDRR